MNSAGLCKKMFLVCIDLDAAKSAEATSKVSYNRTPNQFTDTHGYNLFNAESVARYQETQAINNSFNYFEAGALSLTQPNSKLVGDQLRCCKMQHSWEKRSTGCRNSTVSRCRQSAKRSRIVRTSITWAALD